MSKTGVHFSLLSPPFNTFRPKCKHNRKRNHGKTTSLSLTITSKSSQERRICALDNYNEPASSINFNLSMPTHIHPFSFAYTQSLSHALLLLFLLLHPLRNTLPPLNQISNIHWHLINLRIIKLLNISQHPHVIIRDKVNRHTLPTKPPTTSYAMDVVLPIRG